MLKSALRAAWRRLPLKLPLLRVARALVRPPERLYRHLHFQGAFEVEVAPGARFRIRSHGNAVENDLFWAGYAGNWERESLRLWRALAREASIVLDVGANTGVYALAAAALNPQAQVVAFEPVPRVCARLRANVELNGGRITVEAVAASDRDGVAMLHDTAAQHVYSASLDPAMLGSGTARSYEVPIVALDGYCARHGIDRVDLVKIDVERHEPAVMRGFRRGLKRSRPAVLIEILDAAIGAEVAKAIAGLDYVAYAIRDHGGPGEAVPTTELGTDERNYLLCQPATARHLGLAAAEAIA